MARRNDPAKLYIAHRTGLINRLVREAHVSEHTAEKLLLAWEAEGERRHLDARTGDWWAPAWAWILEQREHSRR